MKTLRRNKRLFYYAVYEDAQYLRDGQGYMTGEKRNVYGKPIKSFANISAAKGDIETRQFGEDATYDRVIVTDNEKLPINENSILWIDTTPVIETDGSTKTPHDYTVKRIARSLNSVSIAVKKVFVNG